MPLARPAALARRLILPAVVLASLALAVRPAHAQEQERKLLDRIMHPNMDLHFDGFEKSFDAKASDRDKHAMVRPFGFGGRRVNTKSGDGAFHAKTFNDGRGNFTTESFAVRKATAADRQALPTADRSFATRSVDVREDRVANKSANTREYVTGEKPYLVPGKRQDTLDDIRNAKNLSIDQIRELLNKSR